MRERATYSFCRIPNVQYGTEHRKDSDTYKIGGGFSVIDSRHVSNIMDVLHRVRTLKFTEMPMLDSSMTQASNTSRPEKSAQVNLQTYSMSPPTLFQKYKKNKLSSPKNTFQSLTILLKCQ
jgi:hypothetical protein